MRRLPSEALVALDTVWAQYVGRTIKHDRAVGLAQAVRMRYGMVLTNAEIEDMLRDVMSPSARAALTAPR